MSYGRLVLCAVFLSIFTMAVRIAVDTDTWWHGAVALKHGIDPGMVDYFVVAGNTTMNHLFYGIDPQHIREEPYIPTATFFPLILGKNIGLSTDPQAVVYALPNVASYVGGDITAGVLVSQMHKKDKVSLFIDVGTNGEIVLGNKEWLVTAACSAGPAFEGSGIKFGMRAMEGAIEEVEIDPKTFEVNYQVIGDAKPIGICGSGYDRHPRRDVPDRSHRPEGQDPRGDQVETHPPGRERPRIRDRLG